MTTLIAPTPMTITTDELEQLESKVRNGLASFVDVGNALMEIRDRGGYKRRGYKTFEEYCQREFGQSDRHARRLITAAQTAVQVEKVIGAAPRSEGVARELDKIADDPVVLEKVEKKLKSERKPLSIATATAEKVKEVVAAVTGHKPRPPAASPAPKPAGRPAAAAPAAPAAPSDAPAILELQAVLTRARAFLRGHPAFKDAPDAERLVEQLGRGIEQLDDWLAGAYDRSAGSKAGKGGKSDVVSDHGAPRCPHCKEPIEPGAVFCDKCGAVL